MDQHSGTAFIKARFESVGRLHGTSIKHDTQPLCSTLRTVQFSSAPSQTQRALFAQKR